MRLVTFSVAGQTRWGAAVGDTVVDLNLAHAMYRAARGQEAKYLAADSLDFLRQGPSAWQAAKETLAFLGDRSIEGIVYKSDAVKWLAPILYPPKIVAIGLDSREHAQEQTDIATAPTYPVLFPKFPTAVIGWGEPITWDPSLTQKVDYEAELGVVIGQRATRVSADKALDYVFGYCNLNDISARDLQFDEKGAKQWARGKSLDTFCPIGPYIVSKDEIPDPQTLNIRGFVNGQVVQDSNTRYMIAGVAQLIDFISHGVTLLPGDIIATGTPPGVGHYRKPPVYLKPGDVVGVEVEGLGRLTNPIKQRLRN